MDVKRVLVLDNNDVTRTQLIGVIHSHPNLALLAAVSLCSEAQVYIKETVPEVIVLDVDLPDGDGVEFIRNLRYDGYDQEIMVLTEFGDEEHVIAAIKAGATGYLLKGCSSYYIGESIMQITNGGAPMSAPIARYVLERFSESENLSSKKEINMEILTKRELDVLSYLSKGFTYHEISGILDISYHTTTTHLKNIYRKLEVCSRAEAIYEATKLGMINWDS